MGPKEFHLSDSVLMRIVQIVQEGFLTGTDVADLMREIRLQEHDNDSLVLTDKYVELVKKSHEDLLARAAELSGVQTWSTDGFDR